MQNASKQNDLEAIWEKTHPDYKGYHEGERTVLVNVKGATVLTPLNQLTDEQIARKLGKDPASKVMKAYEASLKIALPEEAKKPLKDWRVSVVLAANTYNRYPESDTWGMLLHELQSLVSQFKLAIRT